MDTYLAQIQSAYSEVITALVTAAVTPKPTYSLEGQSVSHGEYLSMLIDSAKKLLDMWTELEPFQIVSGSM